MNTVLVIGGTGAMGSRVVRRLSGTPDTMVRVLTRDPSSDQATSLSEAAPGRVELARGDVTDPASVAEAMTAVDGVFCNTDFYSTMSPLGEYEMGLGVLRTAQEARVPRFIWSSLDFPSVLTDGRIRVPHYDGKAAVATYVALRQSEEMMRHEVDGWYSNHVGVLVTAPYFENFQFRVVPEQGPLPDGREGLTFALPLGRGRYPLIGLDDIAWFCAFMLDNWPQWGGRTLRVVADSLTGEEIAAAFERVTGIPSAYRAVPLDVVRDTMPDTGHDMAAMFDFFQHYDVFSRARDVAYLRHVHPDLLSFEDWIRNSGWDGTMRRVQKRAVQVAGRGCADQVG